MPGTGEPAGTEGAEEPDTEAAGVLQAAEEQQASAEARAFAVSVASGAADTAVPEADKQAAAVGTAAAVVPGADTAAGTAEEPELAAAERAAGAAEVPAEPAG